MKIAAQKIGFIMDAPSAIHTEKDSSIVLIEEALQRNHDVYYIEQKNLCARDGEAFAKVKKISCAQDIFLETVVEEEINLNAFGLIFMRKDPPVDMNYIYTTLLLELAENQGVKIINKPSALRDVNEKLFINWFPQCCAPTLVSNSFEQLKNFLAEHKDIILKPLNGMGGTGIFRVTETDPNIAVIVETLTQNYSTLVMAQKYIPEITQGDKRIIMMHGAALPYAITRLPKQGETRANLAAGGSWIKAELSERDQWICGQVGPILKNKGLLLVGLDIIGDYLTEVNVTSPTCLRQINQAFNVNTASFLFERL